ncbi:unknown secreted protein, putative [Babesia ovata]|uniref:Uncharacterized protein n=1 Tax=Babesia ovata TaxID=189622 RepID=A0A2H6KEX1_9APIC|nr:unknown secreted protein, putative [Babesia ovata]GBE61541.1 unknown secreted protein, putative [Babesia ovata]
MIRIVHRIPTAIESKIPGRRKELRHQGVDNVNTESIERHPKIEPHTVTSTKCTHRRVEGSEQISRKRKSPVVRRQIGVTNASGTQQQKPRVKHGDEGAQNHRVRPINVNPILGVVLFTSLTQDG